MLILKNINHVSLALAEIADLCVVKCGSSLPVGQIKHSLLKGLCKCSHPISSVLPDLMVNVSTDFL